ncbi:MAG: murein hydrolase activator EnvC family protein [Faecousia sp.]
MYKYRRIIVSCIALLLILSLLAGFVVMIVNAKTSSEIQQEIDALEEQSNELAAEREKLESEIAENESKTLTVVEQKAQVDQEIELTRQEVVVVNEQIHQYNMLIAEKQAELDELEQKQSDLFDRYSLRMRALQERGSISIWSVILESESFSDLLRNRVMIEEIALADQRMMDEMRSVAAEILEAKDELAAEKAKLEQKKAELAESEAHLAEKREESDALLTQLVSDKQKLLEETEKYEAQEAELSNQIAALEQERTEALQREWEAQHPTQPENSGSSGDNTDPAPVYPSSGESFMFPLPAGWGVVLTSSYGYRVHPITGNYSFHNGVDLAIGQGTPIYASKSGYVTTATYNYAYGYYVTINHMDGFSTLYGHMTNYVVSEGQYVERGQVIGYVGSTGYSTGPHLHFTIYYNGGTVNPMEYIYLQ